MLHSIRWRLVASFALLTLISVTAVGVVAVFLVDRYAERQAIETLTASAEAMAARSFPLVAPMVHEAELEELTQAAAFLDGVRVRVLDEHGAQLVDTGHGGGVEQMIWVGGGDADDAWLGDDAGLAALLAGPVTVSVVGRATEAAEAAALAKELAAESLDASALTLQPPHVDAPGGELPFDVLGQSLVVIRRSEGGQQQFDYVLGGVDPGSGTGAQLVVPPLDEALVARGVVELEVPGDGLDSGLRMGRHLDHRIGAVFSSRLPHQSVVVPIGEPMSPVGYIEITEAGDPAAEARSTAARAFALAGAAATLLSMLVGLVVSRTLTAPLAELTRAADEMSEGDLSARAPVRGRDEIAVLGVQFNSMADRLQESFGSLQSERDALRRFIADASHELRTPITALKTYNSLLAEGASDDPAAQREFLADSRIQLNRLEWITHNLLDLSRLEAGLVELDVGEHDAADLLTAALAPHEVAAEAKSVDIEVSVPTEPLQVLCDGARLELALGNLVDNAIKFTPEGGTIAVGVEPPGRPSAQRVRFVVEDSGPGIAADEADRIFERLYRGTEGGRDPSDDETTAGSGLGLAIARSVVEAHDGEIRLDHTGPDGSRFVIELPAGPSRA